MDETTFQRSLRHGPPADPVYRPRLSGQPGVVTAFTKPPHQDERADPHPASDIRINSTTGRTRLMLTPAKATVVGALAVTIGAVVFIAQPFRQANVPITAADTGATLVMEDGTRDFKAQPQYTDEGDLVETRGPADADLVSVTVSIEGDRITVRFETAEAVPQVPHGGDPVVYKLLIDTDGDPEPEYETWYEYVDVDGDAEDRSDDRWLGWLQDLDSPEGEQVESEAPVVVDGVVTASFGLDALPVAPSEMRFAAIAVVYGGFDDTNNIFNWTPFDRVPDDESAWRALDETADS